MATVLNYAELSDVVYDDDPRMPGWDRIGFKPAGSGLSDAFQGAAFRKDGEVVIAFKGTSSGVDLATDFKLGVGMNTYQFSEAEKFTAECQPVIGTKVTITGHSLGGAIAQIVGNRRRLPFMTFNAPGVGLVSRNLDEMAVTALGTAAVRTAGVILSAFWHPMQAGRDLNSVFYRVTGVNFRLGKDVVGCVGVHYGKVIEIPYSGGAMDVLAKHKMGTFLKHLRGSEYANHHLEAYA